MLGTDAAFCPEAIDGDESGHGGVPPEHRQKAGLLCFSVRHVPCQVHKATSGALASCPTWDQLEAVKKRNWASQQNSDGSVDRAISALGLTLVLSYATQSTRVAAVPQVSP